MQRFIQKVYQILGPGGGMYVNSVPGFGCLASTSPNLVNSLQIQPLSFTIDTPNNLALLVSKRRILLDC